MCELELLVDRSCLAIDPQPVMRASSLLIVRDAALAGVGVALLPRSIIGSRLESGELVQWGTTGKVVELWALHTSRRLPQFAGRPASTKAPAADDCRSAPARDPFDQCARSRLPKDYSWPVSTG